MCLHHSWGRRGICAWTLTTCEGRKIQMYVHGDVFVVRSSTRYSSRPKLAWNHKQLCFWPWNTMVLCMESCPSDLNMLSKFQARNEGISNFQSTKWWMQALRWHFNFSRFWQAASGTFFFISIFLVIQFWSSLATLAPWNGWDWSQHF